MAFFLCRSRENRARRRFPPWPASHVLLILPAVSAPLKDSGLLCVRLRMWGSFLGSSPSLDGSGGAQVGRHYKGRFRCNPPFAPALQSPQEGQCPLWLGTELSECSVPGEGRPSGQAGRDLELSHRVSPRSLAVGRSERGSPGSGGDEDSFWLCPKRRGKAAQVQLVVCRGLRWRSLFWKIDGRN